MKLVTKTFLFFLMTSALALKNLKPIQVILLARHGSRTHTVDVSKHYKSYWMDRGLELGDLTPNGFTQHFQLGRQLKREYSKLLDTQYNQKKHFFKSSNTSRTMQSSMGVFEGMFGEGRLPELHNDLNDPNCLPPWKDIQPVKPDEVNFELELSSIKEKPDWLEVEPDMRKEHVLQAYQTPEFKKMIKFYQKDIDRFFRKIIQTEAFKTIVTQSQALSISKEALTPLKYLQYTDYFVSEHANNPKSEFEAEFMHFVNLVNHAKHIRRYINPIGNKALSTPAMHYIRDIIQKRVAQEKGEYKGEDERKLDFVSLLSHDTQLTPMLLNFKLKNMDLVIKSLESGEIVQDYVPKPGFASNFVFELLESEDQHYYVRFRYNGEYLNFCQLEEGEVQNWPCEIEQFNNYVSKTTFKDWRHFLMHFDDEEGDKDL